MFANDQLGMMVGMSSGDAGAGYRPIYTKFFGRHAMQQVVPPCFIRSYDIITSDFVQANSWFLIAGGEASQCCVILPHLGNLVQAIHVIVLWP